MHQLLQLDQAGKERSLSVALKAESDLTALQATVTELQRQLQIATLKTDVLADTITSALNGAMSLALDSASEDIDAADLNTAAAGTLSRTFAVTLRTSNGAPHLWAAFEPVVTPGETVADVDVTAPTVSGNPAFSAGVALVTITFDTDAGATKVYVATDEVTVQIQVSATDTLLGHSVVDVTKTYVVV